MTTPTRGRRRAVLLLPLALATLVAAGPGTAAAADDGCTPAAGATLTDVLTADDWSPVTPSRWSFTGEEAILEQPGTNPGGPRRPFEIATLTTGPEWADVTITGQARFDPPVALNNHDVVVVFGYQGPTQYYYAHLSADDRIYAHNGIFVVDDADRLRIDDQYLAGDPAPPAWRDGDWHDVEVRRCVDTGRIEVRVDGAEEPLMTATDTTFGAGRVGFGSFDNVGRLRGLTVSGAPLAPWSKDSCKDGGWAAFTAPGFDNQGRCVAWWNAAATG